MTNILKFTIIAVLAFVTAPSPAKAQDFGRTLEQFSQMNRTNPLQNRDFSRSDDVLNRKILDRKNKVVGTVKDISIRSNGTINTITVDFNRLRLSNEVALNYRELRIDSRSNTYALNLDSDEIQEFYPQLLANIETAAGDDAEITSVRQIQGATLQAEDGIRLGKIRHVLFGGNGSRVDALFAELSIGTMRGNTAAIPFRNTNLKRKNGRVIVALPNDLVEALFEVADR